ncbi:hypothetical protein AVEN_96129-1 [Araneus ventricosus]|uniref:Uncharacterized protein n=1 Tax=Araneus ventricosus TaxID=182803 RepID=A0A4Y2UMZ0_ARAVE|nr:hypothetical protein AVEN_96129-1 [Araneus ventricosus]
MLAHLEKKDDKRGQDPSLVLKKVSVTRWFASADAIKALSEGYSSFQRALKAIAGDNKKKPEMVHEAKCLLNDLEKKKVLSWQFSGL